MGEPTKPEESRRSNHLTLVLLALAAVVGAVALYLHTSQWTQSPPRRVTPTPSLAGRVLGAARPLMDAGRYEAAADLMRAYVRQYPGDVAVRATLAEAQLQLGRLDEAGRNIQVLRSLSPRMPQALWLAGELARLQKDPACEELFRQAVESPLAGADIWARYGLELMARGEDVRAEDYLQRAVEAGLRDAETLGGLGRLALERGDFAQAEVRLSAALTAEPENSQLRALLAAAQKNRGKLEDAERTLRAGLASQPSPLLRFAMGEVLMLQGRYAEAAEAYEAASQDPPMRPEASLRAAMCYYHAGRHAAAEKCIDIAAADRPDDQMVRKYVRKIQDARLDAAKDGAGPPEPPAE